MTRSRSRNNGSDRSRRNFIKTAAGIGIAIAVPWVKSKAAASPDATTIKDPRFTAPVIDPAAIPKFVDPLPVPGGQWPVVTGPAHSISVKLVNCQVLPESVADFPRLSTPCWAYRTNKDYLHTYLGPTIVGIHGKNTRVTFDYSAVDPARHLLRTGDSKAAGAATVIDRHVHGTNRGEPEVRFVAHKHGNIGIGEKSDGYSESWITPDGKTAATHDPDKPMPLRVGFEADSDLKSVKLVHDYPNIEGASTGWYHDHALGITRLNVYAGMAGGFLVTDDVEAKYITEHILPTLGGRFDIPLVIQDRMFYADGSFAYPDQPAESKCTSWPGGPSTLTEFFGDCMLVNGKTWPVFDVEPAKYRLRFLNGCNSRFLELGFDAASAKFIIIGTEGGLLPSAVSRDGLLLGPAERFDVIFDFTPYAGKLLTLNNSGNKPFPGGSAPKREMDGVIMQFRVKPSLTGAAEITNALPSRLNLSEPPFEKRTQVAATRRVLLFEGMDEFGRTRPLLGHVTGTPQTGLSGMPLMWSDPVTETPKAGTLEIWEIYNTTMDAHPIHLHEVLLSVLDRQPISFDNNTPAMSACNTPMNAIPINVASTPRPSELYERGLKDTVIAYPREVTRIIPDFTAAKPGRFAWHCHLLEHEDHEMMRPYDVIG